MEYTDLPLLYIGLICLSTSSIIARSHFAVPGVSEKMATVTSPVSRLSKERSGKFDISMQDSLSFHADLFGVVVGSLRFNFCLSGV